MTEPVNLEVAALRRVIERHVRWNEKALHLLQQVDAMYDGEWREVAEFVRKSTERITTGCNHPPDARDLTFCRICGQTLTAEPT